MTQSPSSSALPDDTIAALAQHVYGAQRDAKAISKLTNAHPAFSIDDGYRVQNALRAIYTESGHRVVGWKAGLTSKAKMRQMGVDKPSVGFLTDKMWVPEGTVVDTSSLVHPRVEAELAFVLKDDLPTSGCTVDDVLAATAWVTPAIEVIDSRYENFKFDLMSVIADNSSSARFALSGAGKRLATLDDRTTLGLALLNNGELLTTGATAAVLGDPAAAVALVADLVGALGAQLLAGMTVLSGGITQAFAVAPGDHVSVRMQGLGGVDLRFA